MQRLRPFMPVRPLPARLSRSAGIAVGAILFVLAIIAAVAAAFTAADNFTGSTINADRILREVRSQGDLIRAKVNECYMNVNAVDHSGGSVYSTSNFPVSTGSGTAVEDLECPTYGSGQQNLWTGQSQTLLPPPPMGLDKWYYVNAGDSGGRCIRIAPSTGNLNDSTVIQGLTEAAAGFSDLERIFDANSGSKRFILWITKPTGPASADCSS